MYTPFIVGVGRSGTTLLRMMLDSHPCLTVPPETHFWAKITESPGDFDDRTSFYRYVTSHATWKNLDLNKSLFKKALKSQKKFTAAFGMRAFYHCYALTQNKPFYGEKTPLYLKSMDKIQQQLPEACFIHIIRDGRDVALSYQKVHFGPNEITKLAKLWQDRIKEGRLLAKKVRYLEIKYEKLISNTEDVLKECMDFIGLDYSKKMLDYHEESKTKLEAMKDIFIGMKGETRISKEHRMHYHRHTQSKPLESRCHAWKETMQPEDVLAFENIAGNLLEELGYGTTT